MLRRVFCILLALAVAPTAAADAKSVFAKAAPSVVVVVAQDGGGEQTSQGSGVVVGEGVAVTNCHVIENAAKVSIRQAADAQAAETYLMNAEVVARDEDNDLCLLYAPDLSKPPAAKTAAMGNAKNLVIGEEVYAIGAPQGLELSLSRGIVAQLRGGNSGAPIIQTDAAISHGSSGGGLFNENGGLVGITTFKRRGESLNFAMPVGYVVRLMESAGIESEAIAALQKENKIAWRALWQECTANIQHRCVMELAKQTAQQIRSAGEREKILRDIAGVQASDIGNNDAMQIAQQIDKNVRPIVVAAIWRMEIGDESSAKQMFFDAANMAPDHRALHDIATVQAMMGDSIGAMQTARLIHDKSAEALVFAAIAKVLKNR